MSISISRIMDQIERLQKQAAAIQQEAVVRIRKEIVQLGLTPEHLFGDVLPRKVTKVKTAAIAKFADESGNTWGGMGKRPEWLRQALAAGKSLEDFLVNKSAENTKLRKTSVTMKVARKKSVPRVAAAAKPVKTAAKKFSKTAPRAAEAKTSTPKKVAPKKAAAKKIVARKAAPSKPKAQSVPAEAATS